MEIVSHFYEPAWICHPVSRCLALTKQKKGSIVIMCGQSGSHIIYEKNGIHYTATFHGSKEVGKGLEMKIKKEMGLK